MEDDTRKSSKAILFMDLDGVLNSKTWFSTRPKSNEEYKPEFDLDPKKIELINTLEDLNLEVVVSSVWRLFRNDCREILRSVGFKLPFAEDWRTKNLGSVSRGAEIAEWIFRHSEEISNFVILDDDSDMVVLSFKLVKTEFEFGLEDKHILQIRGMLK